MPADVSSTLCACVCACVWFFIRKSETQIRGVYVYVSARVRALSLSHTHTHNTHIHITRFNITVLDFQAQQHCAGVSWEHRNSKCLRIFHVRTSLKKFSTERNTSSIRSRIHYDISLFESTRAIHHTKTSDAKNFRRVNAYTWRREARETRETESRHCRTKWLVLIALKMDVSCAGCAEQLVIGTEWSWDNVNLAKLHICHRETRPGSRSRGNGSAKPRGWSWLHWRCSRATRTHRRLRVEQNRARMRLSPGDSQVRHSVY
jgi:hypothetical protein